MKHTLLIDLDDTLYPERSYVESGFVEIANHLASKCSQPWHKLYDHMIHLLDSKGRGQIFNETLAFAGIDFDKAAITQLVQIYRSHSPNVNLYDGVFELLQHLKIHHTLAIVTDGLPLMQMQKVKALELDQLIDHIFYPWAYNHPKPAAESYGHAIKDLKCAKNHCIIIGDNPVNDGSPARDLGVPFWQVTTENKFQVQTADRTFDHFTDIGPELEHLELPK